MSDNEQTPTAVVTAPPQQQQQQRQAGGPEEGPAQGGPAGQPGVDCWPEPEVAENVDATRLGDLGLTMMEGSNLLRFLETLTDE